MIVFRDDRKIIQRYQTLIVVYMNIMHLDPRNIGEISCGISAIKYLFFFFFCCAVKSSQKLMCSSKRKLITTTDIIY